MIQLVIFDLDGVLIKTEELKALSYAKAAAKLLNQSTLGRGGQQEALAGAPHELRNDGPIASAIPDPVESQVFDAYRKVVGRSRQELATFILKSCGLEERARELEDDFHVKEPWEVLSSLRISFYDKMISDPQVVRDNQWEDSVSLVWQLLQSGYRTALATMSERSRTSSMLNILGLSGAFDLIATADDVRHGKPNPEIYDFISRRLSIPPAQCLVLEDSPAGIESGLAAGMHVLGVTTPITKDAVRASGLLPDQWIVDDPGALKSVVQRIINEESVMTSSKLL